MGLPDGTVHLSEKSREVFNPLSRHCACEVRRVLRDDFADDSYGIEFDQDNEMSPPATVLEFKRRILAADAILFATPEYNCSLSGGLKNAIDWASRPYGESAWLGKPVAVMGACVGSLRTVRAQYHLWQILVTLNMPVGNQPEVMIGNAAQRFDQHGGLTDEPTRQFIQRLLGALLQLVKESARRANARLFED